MIVDLDNCVEQIEEKLKSEALALPEVKLLNGIIESFVKVWKLVKTHPELTKLYSSLIYDTFVDMSQTFYRNSSLTYTCEVCEVDIPMRNNDLQFSYQMHEQSSEHRVALENFELLAKMMNGTSKKSVAHVEEQNDDNDEASSVSSSCLNGLLPKSSIAETNEPSSTESKTVTSQMARKARNKLNETKWPIVKRGNEQYCVPCNVILPSQSQYTQHVSSKKHKNKLHTVKPRNHAIPVTASISLYAIPKIQDIYGENPEYRYAYFLNKFSIYRTCSSFHCLLCSGQNLSNLNATKIHLSSNVHVSSVKKYSLYCFQYQVPAIDVGIQFVERGHLFCVLCNRKLLSAQNFISHVYSYSHKQKVKSQYNVSGLYDTAGKGIVLNLGVPYCVLCHVDLPTESTMNAHIYGGRHITSVKNNFP